MAKQDFDRDALGNKIRNLRKKAGLTQNTLSEIVGVDSKHISHIENATGSCSLATFIAMANALGTNTDYPKFPKNYLPYVKKP